MAKAPTKAQLRNLIMAARTSSDRTSVDSLIVSTRSSPRRARAAGPARGEPAAGPARARASRRCHHTTPLSLPPAAVARAPPSPPLRCRTVTSQPFVPPCATRGAPQPPTISHQPSAISHRPAAISQQPPTHQPPSHWATGPLGHHLPTISHQATNHQPSAISHQATNHWPSITAARAQHV